MARRKPDVRCPRCRSNAVAQRVEGARMSVPPELAYACFYPLPWQHLHCLSCDRSFGFDEASEKLGEQIATYGRALARRREARRRQREAAAREEADAMAEADPTPVPIDAAWRHLLTAPPHAEGAPEGATLH